MMGSFHGRWFIRGHVQGTSRFLYRKLLYGTVEYDIEKSLALTRNRFPLRFSSRRGWMRARVAGTVAGAPREFIGEKELDL